MTSPTGAVYDRGYRTYDGPRGGRSAARWALFRASVRRALGLRRSWRQKVFPWTLLGVMVIPAAVNVGIGYVTREEAGRSFSFITYRGYLDGLLPVVLLFAALTAPDLLCPDRRNRVLPLMFSRPLTGDDYVLAKLGALSGVLFAFQFVPQIVLFVGQLLVHEDGALNYLRDNGEVLWQAPISVVLISFYFAAVGLAISSTTTRRIVAGASMLGLMLISSAVAGILSVDSSGELQEDRPGGVLDLLTLPLHLRDLVFLGELAPDRLLSDLSYGGALGRRRVRGGDRRVARAPAPPLPVGRALSMHVDDPAFAPDASVEVQDVSVWFGQKVALSELSCSFGPGVTGLLGPNGAGKTTLMRAVCGLLDPNTGAIRVRGGDPRTDRAVQRHLALVPEDEAVPGPLSPRELVRYRADLHGVKDRAAPDRCLAEVGLLDVADREVGSFSKGMRQRSKVAAALVSDPSVLILDEPLNGADPVQRVNLIALFKRLGAEGRTVIVSSHVLNEVERLAERVIVLVRGRLAAAGDRHAIRDAMADRPRRVLVRATPARALGRRPRGRGIGESGSASRTRRSPCRRCGPATSPSPCPGSPETSGRTCARSGRSTSRSRASSARWCADGATAAVRRDRRLRAQGVPAHQAPPRTAVAVRRRRPLRVAQPAQRRRPGRGVRQRRQRDAVRHRPADRVPDRR